MSHLKSFGVAVALLALSGCANNASCACPVVQKLTLFANPVMLSFANIGSAYSQNVTLTAPKGVAGTVTEVDNCTTSAGSIVTIQIPADSETPVAVVVTPTMSGSCSIQFSSSYGGGFPVTIEVSPTS
jgi:hypothetical protein